MNEIGSADAKRSTDPEPTVFVVDDDAAVRAHLRELIGSVGLRVETYASAGEFRRAYDPLRPGCLVLDVRLPGQSGPDLQRDLVEHSITLPIIMITAYGEVPVAVRALRAGAMDFVEKPFDSQLLLDRIHEAIATGREQRRRARQRAEVRQQLASLSPRQQAVLDALVAGKPSKVIADELGVTQKTVDVHRYRLMQRLEVTSLPDLFRLVLLARGEDAEGRRS